MKTKKVIFTFVLFFAAMAIFQTRSCYADNVLDTDPVSHDIWDGLLKKYVHANGLVDYKGFQKDSTQLNKYLDLLASTHPEKSWSKEEQMAYWINAYNAFTVKLIINHYPVSSIKDIKNGIAFINSVWDIKFINLKGQVYDLNNLEHGILRKEFDDARIHAAINCASYSCPKLRNEAYVASKLDAQLQDAMIGFINDPLRNEVNSESAQLSKIFTWFSGDFKKNAGSIRDFINRFAKTKLKTTGKIEYKDYDWRLNEI